MLNKYFSYLSESLFCLVASFFRPKCLILQATMNLGLLLSSNRRRATLGNTRIVLGGTVGAEYIVTIFIRPSKMPILYEPQCCLQSVPKSIQCRSKHTFMSTNYVVRQPHIFT